MTLNEARLIRELKRRCTYRRLAEIYYSKKDIAYGVRGYGQDLCIEAFAILYPKLKHPNKAPEFTNRRYWLFVAENRSYFGDYYWWE